MKLLEHPLVATAREASDCRACPLHETRTHVVFGEGSLDPDVMLVTEAPSALEDEQGRPFGGDRGVLVDELLELAGLARGDVYLTTILKCALPGRRDPRPTEIEACSRYLFAQLRELRPRVIVTFGGFSTKLIRRDGASITRCAGHELPIRLGDLVAWSLPLYGLDTILGASAWRRRVDRIARGIPKLLGRELVDARFAILELVEPPAGTAGVFGRATTGRVWRQTPDGWEPVFVAGERDCPACAHRLERADCLRCGGVGRIGPDGWIRDLAAIGYSPRVPEARQEVLFA